MNNLQEKIFVALYKDACKLCFGNPLTGTLTEADSKLMSNEIFDRTGLVIGAKTLRNYSQYIFNDLNDKKENPATSTLDTLARYVLKAPVTNEADRKINESHFPWWFRYKKEFFAGSINGNRNAKPMKKIFYYLFAGSLLVVMVISWLLLSPIKGSENFTDPFTSLNEDSIQARGWMVKSMNRVFWKRRNETPGCLTLFTLIGDNWPDSTHGPRIQNLLIRKVYSGCFTAELHFKSFIPEENWQQAGILLLEDTSFTGRSLRFSLIYNDYSGGAPENKEILIQSIISSGGGSLKPEEIIHAPVFNPGRDSREMIRDNLIHSALRIEKNGNHFRLLFSDGAFANSAFKELLTKDSDLEPRYLGIFALKGFVDTTQIKPVQITYFSISQENCK